MKDEALDFLVMAVLLAAVLAGHARRSGPLRAHPPPVPPTDRQAGEAKQKSRP